jgi:hypothetical protein
MNSENDHAGDDPTATSSTFSVPIDLSGYKTAPEPKPLRTYYSDDEPGVALYLDGAGGVTNDPTRVVTPSPAVILSATARTHNSRPQGATSATHQVLPPTNVLAVMALVFALIGGTVVAVVLGHIAVSQIGRTGERGEGMAKAALVIGYLSLVISVIILAVSLAPLVGASF